HRFKAAIAGRDGAPCGRWVSRVPRESSLPGHSVTGTDLRERCEVHPRLRCVPEKEEREQLRHWRRNLPSRSRRDDRDCAEFAAGRRAVDTNKPQFTSIAKGEFPLSSGPNSLSLDRDRGVTID